MGRVPVVPPNSIYVLILEDQEADFELVMGELTRAGLTVRVQRAETEEEFRARLMPTWERACWE